MTPFETPELVWAGTGPFIALAGGGVVSLLVFIIWPRARREVFAGVALAAVAAAAVLTGLLVDQRVTLGMQGTIAVDGVALFATMILLVTAALATLLSTPYLEARGIRRPEYYTLLLFATAGMVLLVAANDLLVLFLAIETLSLSLYVMAGIARRDAGSQESALKYFLLGAFSSAFLLYGIALVFAATGSTNLGVIADRVAAGGVDGRLLFTAIALFVVGFGFKIGAVPFHMWTPDVYQGAPTSVTAFMAAGTKAAGVVALLRVFLVAFGAVQWDWIPVLWAVSAASMIVGSILAIAQTDVKRMLAYSSIAHAGSLLVGVVAASQEGTAGALFYLLAYTVMVLGSFGLVMLSAPGGRERLRLSDWAGIGQRHPLFAGAMTLFLLSLAGIPPTAGFVGKLWVFLAAVEAGEVGLVVIGLLATAVAAFFYLRLIVIMWLTDPAPAAEPEPFGPPLGFGAAPAPVAAVGIAAAATVLFGVWPAALMTLARAAAVFTG